MNSTNRKPVMANTMNIFPGEKPKSEQIDATIANVYSDEKTVIWHITGRDGKAYEKRSDLQSVKSVDYLRKELQNLGFPGVGNPLDFNYRDLIGLDMTIIVESQEGYPFPKIFIVRRNYKATIAPTQKSTGDTTVQKTENTIPQTADVEKIKRLFAELCVEVAKLN